MPRVDSKERFGISQDEMGAAQKRPSRRLIPEIGILVTDSAFVVLFFDDAGNQEARVIKDLDDALAAIRRRLRKRTEEE
jgi:hypothetical protein